MVQGGSMGIVAQQTADHNAGRIQIKGMRFNANCKCKSCHYLDDVDTEITF